jgi:intracellular sulfur oxidation DsrE/DsrF family protein
MNVVFHLSTDTEQQRRKAVNNMTNLLEDETVDIDDMALVTNSSGIELLVDGSAFNAQIEALADQGAQFKVCGNSLWKSDYEEDDLHPVSEVVSSGVGELARLQERGFHYLSP